MNYVCSLPVVRLFSVTSSIPKDYTSLESCNLRSSGPMAEVLDNVYSPCSIVWGTLLNLLFQLVFLRGVSF